MLSPWPIFYLSVKIAKNPHRMFLMHSFRFLPCETGL